MAMHASVHFSGGQAWDETLPALTSWTARSLPNHLSLVAVLLAITLLPLCVYFARYSKLSPRNMANEPAINGKPQDTSKNFKGDIKVNNNPPTKEQLEKVADLPVFDANKESYTFKSLYADNENGPRRVLVVFIRHFFCGNCQDYLRTLASSVPPTELSTLSPPTSIIVIGCGQPELIPMYIRETSCPFPIYADPTRKLYDILGMTKTFNLGPQAPKYTQRSVFSMAVSSFLQELRSGRKMLSGGDYRQVGGEFLFSGEKITFCKRMKTTRDHTEIPEVRKHLGLDGKAGDVADDTTPPARKRWSTSGLGAGLGRRLSSRRRSWAPQGSGSRNPEAKESPARSGMQQLKEEETEVNGTATPEDALAKLEGKEPIDEVALPKENGHTHTSTDDSTNGTANGTAHPIPNGEKMGNGHVINGSVTDDTMNSTANGHVTA